MNKPLWLNISLIVFFGMGLGSTVTPASPTRASQVPDNLQVPKNQKLILKAVARGTQIYTCNSLADKPNRFEWVLKAPKADLFDDQGQRLGRHYGGPTWEFHDGSRVMGQVKAKANAPQDSAIPWLLLEARMPTNQVSRTHSENGIFRQVNWVQRLHTVGGVAPKQQCDRAHKNQEVSVRYTADYYFYGVSAQAN